MRKALKTREPGRNDMVALRPSVGAREGENWWLRVGDGEESSVVLRLAALVSRRCRALERQSSSQRTLTRPIAHATAESHDTMASKYAFNAGLKELRFLFCQTSEHSAATRYETRAREEIAMRRRRHGEANWSGRQDRG